MRLKYKNFGLRENLHTHLAEDCMKRSERETAGVGKFVLLDYGVADVMLMVRKRTGRVKSFYK